MQENKNAYNLILPALNDKLSFEANCMMIFRLNHSEWSVRLEKCYVNAASFHFIKTVGLVFLMDSNLTNMLNIWWRVQRKQSALINEGTVSSLALPRFPLFCSALFFMP